MSFEDIQKFSMEIENRVSKDQTTYLEAILSYCEETGLEIEIAAKLVSSAIKSKLQNEGENLHILIKTNHSELPI